MATARRYLLTLTCPDRPGIIAAVSAFIAGYAGTISESASHSEPATGHFFLRQEIVAESLPFDIQELRTRFAPIADEFNMQWNVSDTAAPKRVVLLASTQDHCLADLLYRWRSK